MGPSHYGDLLHIDDLLQEHGAQRLLETYLWFITTQKKKDERQSGRIQAQPSNIHSFRRGHTQCAPSLRNKM
jgi:hypothetical protein